MSAAAPIAAEAPAARAPRKAPAPPPRAREKQAAGEKSAEEVRKELRDYLNHVKEKLGSGPQAKRTPRELLDYLEKLSEYLPERHKRKFRASGERLTMEMLKSRLEGRKGLRDKIVQSYRPQAPQKPDSLTRPLLVDTFSYLKDLSAWHPDKTLGAALRDKIDSLISRVGGGAG